MVVLDLLLNYECEKFTISKLEDFKTFKLTPKKVLVRRVGLDIVKVDQINAQHGTCNYHGGMFH